MGSNSTTATARAPQTAAPDMSILTQGDALWASRDIQPRETDVLMVWPEVLMQAFSSRMLGHGVTINRIQMMCDRRYALQQLMSAYALTDIGLHTLTSQLFFHLEEEQGGRSALH
ncbi:MAG: hypothetical protein WEK74_14585 [Hydrogenophaga sp.]